MKPFLKRFFPIVAALTAVAIAAADELADFKKWYTAGLPGMIKAMESKNMSFFETTSTSDFTYTAGKVTSKKKEALQGLKQMFDTSSSIKCKQTVKGFKAVKGGITVDLMNHYDMTMKPGPDKKVHKMTMDGMTRETWVKQNGKWLLKNITDVGPQKMMMDGKPMPAGMGGG